MKILERVSSVTVATDQDVRAARARRAETVEALKTAELALAREARPGGSAAPVTLRGLELAEDLQAAAADDAEAARALESAEQAARARVLEARRPGRRELVEAVFAQGRLFAAAIRALDTHDDATAAALEWRPPFDRVFAGVVERVAFEQDRAARAGWL
jgi:hypothetical protein